MAEQQFRFGNLDTHAAIIIQRAIEYRKSDLTTLEEFKRMSEKEINGRVSELDQIYNDLDHHIASNVKTEEVKHEAEMHERQLTGIGKQ
jgi:hypothetical protein